MSTITNAGGRELAFNAYQNQTVWMIGSGPSLSDMGDLRDLEGYTFGVNGTHKSDILLRPYDFYGVVEATAWSKYGKGPSDYYFCAVPSWSLVPGSEWFRFSAGPDMSTGEFNGIEDVPLERLARAPVIYEMLQVVFWLGFQNVYLIGCEETGSTTIQGTPHRDYGRDEISKGNKTAAGVFAKHGRNLLNLTPSPALGFIPTGSYEEIVGS